MCWSCRILCPVSFCSKAALVGWTKTCLGFWCFLYKGVEKLHLQASKINVKPPLEKFIGDQSNTKLGRGSKHSSWKRKTGAVSSRMTTAKTTSNGTRTPMPAFPHGPSPYLRSLSKMQRALLPGVSSWNSRWHHCRSFGQRGRPPAVLSWWHQQGSPEKRQAHLSGERHI